MNDTATTPKISASLSMDPQIYSSTNSRSSTLRLTIISHHSSPITIYADDLSPKLMLFCGAFTITDLLNDMKVKQRARTHCRIPPPSKITVPLREHLLYTLLPETPMTLSAPFNLNQVVSSEKPLTENDPQDGGESSASHETSGANELKIGHRYSLGLASVSRVNWRFVRWWEYGTKEEVLRPDGEGRRLDGRRVAFERGPHEAIEIDVSAAGDVRFECVE